MKFSALETGMAWVIKGNAGFAKYGAACHEPSACFRVTDDACAEFDRRGDLLDARRDVGTTETRVIRTTSGA